MPVSYAVQHEQSTLIFAVHVPVYKQAFDLYEYIPFPMSHPQQNMSITIHPSSTLLAVNLKSMMFLTLPPLGKCYSSNTVKLCPNLNLMPAASTDSCLVALFRNNAEHIIQRCQYSKSSSAQPKATRLSSWSYRLFVPKPTNGTFVCKYPGNPIASHSSFTLPQQSIVYLPAACHLVTPLLSLHPLYLSASTQITRHGLLHPNLTNEFFALDATETTQQLSIALAELDKMNFVNNKQLHDHSISISIKTLAIAITSTIVLTLLAVVLLRAHIKRLVGTIMQSAMQYAPGYTSPPPQQNLPLGPIHAIPTISPPTQPPAQTVGSPSPQARPKRVSFAPKTQYAQTQTLKPPRLHKAKTLPPPQYLQAGSTEYINMTRQ